VMLLTADAPAAETARSLAAGEVGQSPDGQWVRRVAPTAEQPVALVLVAPAAEHQGLYALLSVAVVVAGVLAVILAWWLARSTIRPLAELARAADRVADGDLATRVPVRSNDEAGQLAAAFNRMTQRTSAYVQALTASRDQLRGHLAVLGDTLSSTHDLRRILRVILQTALSATGAQSGAVVLLDPAGETLTGQFAEAVTPGGEDAGGGDQWSVPLTVPVSGSLLGAVVTAGVARRGMVAAEGGSLHEEEPRCRTYVVAPISAPGGSGSQVPPWPTPPAVRGVLALYDRLGGDEFDDTDLVTLRTFAGQAAVAVDNVRTHEEAQRLSLTDPLTGLWNYRHLTDSLRREVERASRFGHTLAVLALDLDRFKEVNDVYGHPAGDAVLAEFAHRIRSEIREVDYAFRQGGEEFVVLLPETDARGGVTVAQRLGAAVRDRPIVITPRGATGEVPVAVTVSIGVAVYPDHGLTPNAVLDAADDALYAAKAAGRDTHRVATVAPEPVAAAELTVRVAARTPEGDLPRAGAGRSVPADGGAKPPRQSRGR
jgi:two-component system, cell cycle response regulator